MYNRWPTVSRRPEMGHGFVIRLKKSGASTPQKLRILSSTELRNFQDHLYLSLSLQGNMKIRPLSKLNNFTWINQIVKTVSYNVFLHSSLAICKFSKWFLTLPRFCYVTESLTMIKNIHTPTEWEIYRHQPNKSLNYLQKEDETFQRTTFNFWTP
jgi:hypothetical protein